MFENLKDITIEGGYFELPTTLDLFKDNHSLSIVYGRNGSGKTTIAKAIRQLVDKDTEQQKEEGYIQYTVSTNSPIPEDKNDSVFIFDEEFVRENVRTKGKGLETIVMMGIQVDLDTQIAHKQNEITEIDNELAKLFVLKEKYENGSDTSSPSYFFNRIRDGLREDGGWSDIDRDVKGNTLKSRVTEDLVGRLISLKEPTESEEDLKKQLQLDFSLYRQTADKNAIEWQFVESKLPNDLNRVNALLGKIVERPTLSEREQRLLTFLQDHKEYHSQGTTRQLTEEKWPFCPLCLRETSNKDYEHISDTLKRILNREAENYSKELDEILGEFMEIEMALPDFPDNLYQKERLTARQSTEQLNEDVRAVRNNISQRKKDIYGKVDTPFNSEEMEGYIAHLAKYRDAMKMLGTCVAAFNRSVIERDNLRNKVYQENELLAKKHLKVLLDGYEKANAAYSKCIKNISDFGIKKERLERDIRTLRTQIERTDIALDYINEELQYVFYTDKKLKLVAGDGCYKLQINGKGVPPKRISVGERNVLGLCYFFARLFSDKKDEDKYKDEILIVIDDPVSSFDYGNRLGVISLLRYQFSSIKNGNLNSRILVLTHDLRSAFDLVKIRSELNGGKNGKKKFLELIDKQLKDREVSNEYKKLLENVYYYAKDSASNVDDSVDIGIGNVMRRVLEAFSSFCYNMSFEEMMCREGVLNAIFDEKRRKYYENFMCRLALNGESHMEERVYDLNTITPFFTKQEKVRTAKSLLLFLSYVNREHLSCYFSKKNEGDEDKMAIIDSWKDEESEWLTC